MRLPSAPHFARSALLALTLLSSTAAKADLPPPSEKSVDMPVPTVAAGRIERLSHVSSAFVAPHNVDVWLPPDYPKRGPYAVIYMFDGQMLFDASHAWNHQSWQAADVAASLMAKGETRPFIIVGIWNAGTQRQSEYFPQKPWRSLTDPQRDHARHMDMDLSVAPYSDAYLRFVVKELKPMIDHRYAVDGSRAATAVMGSSMGGLMAMYAISEYPDVFGAAGCLSTHWTGSALHEVAGNPSPDAFVAYLRQHAPSPAAHRIYFDHGTQTLDALYAGTQQRVDALFHAKGYTQGNYLSLVFPGADHSERSWAARLDQPLRFMLPPVSSAPTPSTSR